MSDRKYKLAICRFPGDGWEKQECTTWLMRTLVEMKNDPRIDGISDQVYCDTPITMTRNRAVLKSRLHGCDYILMIDSDMGPDYLLADGQPEPNTKPFWKTAWDFMMARREEEELERKCASMEFDEQNEIEAAVFSKFPPATICAPYCGPPPDECCYIFEWHSYESGCPDPPAFRLQMINREEAACRAGIQEAAALPTGLILYDIRVFNELEKQNGLPWFDYEWEGGLEGYRHLKVTTEDVYQTRNASLLGMPQYVIWDAWAKHHKQKGVSKPYVITRDQVHKCLAHAVEAGRTSRERLTFATRPKLPEKPQTATQEFYKAISCPDPTNARYPQQFYRGEPDRFVRVPENGEDLAGPYPE